MAHWAEFDLERLALDRHYRTRGTVEWVGHSLPERGGHEIHDDREIGHRGSVDDLWLCCPNQRRARSDPSLALRRDLILE
jgi:hypothetical protein